MVKSPKVTIVLLNYNGCELLENYLSSIEALEYSNFEIALVDNDSDDGSVEYVRENHPDVTIIESDENLGFSRGNNLGVAKTESSDYYWFLNTDVRVSPESLDSLVAHIESSDDIGIVVPQIKNMDNESIQSLGYKYGIFGVPRAITDGSNGRLESPEQITYGSGAALLIDADVWEEIGGFDDQNFMYGDDTYLCLNAWLRGYRVEVEPRSVVYHEEGASQSEEQGPLIAYHNARGRTRCYLLTLEPESILLGLGGFLMHSLIRIGKDVLHSQYRTAFDRFRGYATIVYELPEIVAKRKEHQRERQLRDRKFLSKNLFSEWFSKRLSDS